MAMGVFITFRIHDFPDVTVDGSFTSGAAITAVLLVAGFNPLLAVVASFFVGAISGSMTALIHTRFNINGLLAGILVMTGLYSINLHIMGRSNIPLLDTANIISYIKVVNPGLPDEVWLCLIFAVVVALFWIMISLFFKTDFGVTMRATGNNPVMAGALGVNVNAMKIFGISLSNGLVGISGSLVAQYQGFADIGMGIGAIVFSLASVIIGESVLKMRSIYAKFLSVVIGSVIFRLMVALALYVGLNPIDLKLITAVFVLIVLVAPMVLSRKSPKFAGSAGKILIFVTSKRFIAGLCVTALITGIAIFGYKGIKSWTSSPGKGIRTDFVQPKASVIHDDLKKGTSPRKLALFLFSDHLLVKISADGVIDELKRSGVLDKYNITVDIKNAQNDFGMAHSVVQDIIRQQYDYIVTLSTPPRQTTANAKKKIPQKLGYVKDTIRH
jgi:putative ABC transport system permease protein